MIAREATGAERAAMPINDRLRERQTVHMVFSFPRDSEMSADDMKDIVGDAMSKYADQGHKYVMSPHLNGDKLRLDREAMQYMRERVKQAAKIRGYEYDATPFEERFGTKKRRDYEKSVPGKQNMKDPAKRGRTNLERQAPQWYARNGYEHERKRNGLENRLPENRPKHVYMPHMPNKAETKLRDHFASYKDPAAARQSFTEMLAEKPATAYWYANHRPEIFGDVRERPGKLRDKDLGLSQDWFDDANRTLDRAIAEEAPERLARRVEMSHAIIDKRVGEAMREPDHLEHFPLNLAHIPQR